MNYCIKLFFVFLGIALLACPNDVFAQNEDELIDAGYRKRKMRADSCMRVLKEGVLLVRLPTQSRTINALNKVIASDETRKSKKRRLQKRVDHIVKKRDIENNSLVKAIYEKYKFSDFLIIYDTSMHQLKAGVQKGLFLDENRALNPDLSLDNRKYIIMHIGKGHYAQSANRKEGLYFKDSEAGYIIAPFPQLYTTFGVLATALRRFFAKDKNGGIDPSEVSYINERLHFYWAMRMEKVPDSDSE